MPSYNQTKSAKGTQYQQILRNLKNGVCTYGNEKTGITYSLGKTAMKITDGKILFFNSLESMARSINKFIKTGS